MRCTYEVINAAIIITTAVLINSYLSNDRTLLIIYHRLYMRETSAGKCVGQPKAWSNVSNEWHWLTENKLIAQSPY